MHLIPNSLLFGVAPEILVDCARQLHDANEPFTLDQFCKVLGAPAGESEVVLEELLTNGFFQLDSASTGLYLPTIKLGQLALAKISNGLSRELATKLLTQVIEKARLINDDPDKYACHVTCLAVFGSYLTSKSILGDLDIGVELREIHQHDQKRTLGELRRMMQGGATPTSRAMAVLRLQKPKQISLHQLSEVLGLGTPFQIVFGDMKVSDTTFLQQ